MVTSGAISLVWGFVKNVVGQLQFSKRPMLQKMGCLAYNAIDSIGWISYCEWMLKPEGAKQLYLKVYPEKWLVLSALMILLGILLRGLFDNMVHGHGSFSRLSVLLNCQSRRNHQTPSQACKMCSVLRGLMTNCQEGQHGLTAWHHWCCRSKPWLRFPHLNSGVKFQGFNRRVATANATYLSRI